MSEAEEDSTYSHIIRGGVGSSSADAVVLDAMVNGTSVTALCGYTWIPHRDPEKYDICPNCKDIFNLYMSFT